ncbi:hypothetical protein CHS0354_025283, partial [Potamilus streckersoni]
FKLILVITPIHALESAETVPILTLPFGPPSTIPEIQSINAPSPTVISLSWAPPSYPNGPLIGYKLRLTPIGQDSIKPLIRETPANMTSWTFGQLRSSQLYQVTVAALNADGEGPAIAWNISTPNPSN